MRHLGPLAILAGLLLVPGLGRAAASRYDVSYLWHASLAQAQARRAAVAKVLGPRVAGELRVISADGGYGVVYLREGDVRGARVTANAHSRLLRRKKLGKAWPVASQAWVFASDSDTGQSAAAAPAPAAEPRQPRSAPAAKARQTAEQAAEQAAAGQSAEHRELEEMLIDRVNMMRRQGRLAPDERTAWSVYDFTTGETLAEINADLELQSASLVKPFLALAYMSEVAKGHLSYDRQARREMTKMIQVSDNNAADWVMRKVGGPAAAARILHEQFGAILPGVEIEEYIPRSGRTYRNRASARDYSRFLLALWRGELPGSDEIKRLMALPKRDRLRTGVPLPRGIQVYSKTGSTSHLCGDMGVITARGPDGKQYSYALVGIIEKQSPARHYLTWLRSRGNVIRYVSYLVYRQVGAIHGFAAR